MELAYPDPALTDGVVTLRPWRLPDDMATLENAAEDRRITATTTLPEDLTEAAAAAWVERQHQRLSTGTGIALAMAMAHTDHAVGFVGLFGLDRDWRMADLGYWVAPAVRGEGIAQRAVVLLVDWAWQHLDLARIEARIVVDNEPSVRVAEAAGLQREGLHPARYRHGDAWLDLLTYGAANPVRTIPRLTWAELGSEGPLTTAD